LEKKAHHDEELKTKMVNRLKRIEGQIRGITGMVERDVYCDDVLHQFASVDSALKGVKNILLEAHMKSCVVNQIREGNDQVIDELLITIKKI